MHLGGHIAFSKFISICRPALHLISTGLPIFSSVHLPFDAVVTVEGGAEQCVVGGAFFESVVKLDNGCEWYCLAPLLW
jgi:hypothetical protein